MCTQDNMNLNIISSFSILTKELWLQAVEFLIISRLETGVAGMEFKGRNAKNRRFSGVYGSI